METEKYEIMDTDVVRDERMKALVLGGDPRIHECDGKYTETSVTPEVIIIDVYDIEYTNNGFLKTFVKQVRIDLDILAESVMHDN